jgi:hypothetical protein
MLRYRQSSPAHDNGEKHDDNFFAESATSINYSSDSLKRCLSCSKWPSTFTIPCSPCQRALVEGCHTQCHAGIDYRWCLQYYFLLVTHAAFYLAVEIPLSTHKQQCYSFTPQSLGVAKTRGESHKVHLIEWYLNDDVTTRVRRLTETHNCDMCNTSGRWQHLIAVSLPSPARGSCGCMSIKIWSWHVWSVPCIWIYESVLAHTAWNSKIGPKTTTDVMHTSAKKLRVDCDMFMN